jgi:hypothetical protein
MPAAGMAIEPMKPKRSTTGIPLARLFHDDVRFHARSAMSQQKARASNLLTRLQSRQI